MKTFVITLTVWSMVNVLCMVINLVADTTPPKKPLLAIINFACSFGISVWGLWLWAAS